ncbi:MAG: FHA domain-containing protein [Prevotella sp.]|jgi:DNA-directed RNA polymerase subunit RPC12/RpoP|nr:FHA domain-containing protein [Prevotella sp.]
MKRVRCPKCDQYITFDETQYATGQSLIFKCPDCGKEFGIRIGVSKLRNRQKDENPDEQANEAGCGSIVIIENAFHYKQVIPLRMGDNVIGRYQKGNPANCTFETVDPSVDLNHCTITVSRNKKGELRYTLKDNNSNTGTFVDNVELSPKERRIIEDGTLFTLGATSIILRSAESEK